MVINLNPFRPPPSEPQSITVVKYGDTLTINGEDFDFSVIPDGATLPASAVDTPYLADNIERIDGELHVTIRFPHGPDALEAARFPQPIVDPADGPVELPQ